MASRDTALIERLELKQHFFLHHRSRDTDYHYFHAHQGFELLLVHQGRGQALIGEQLVQVESGSLLLFQPFQLHRIHMSAEMVYERSVLVFDPALLDTQLASFPVLQRFYRALWQRRLPLQHLALGELAIEAERVFDHGAVALSSASGERRIEELTLLCLALLQLLRRIYEAADASLDEPGTRPRNLRVAEQAMQWLEQRYGEPFQLARMAEALYVSPSHLSRVFHQETGVTLTEYLTARRLREACLLLKATRLPVREIAGRIGLNNQPYFARLFRTHLGVTPLRYRNQGAATETQDA